MPEKKSGEEIIQGGHIDPQILGFEEGDCPKFKTSIQDDVLTVTIYRGLLKREKRYYDIETGKEIFR